MLLIHQFAPKQAHTLINKPMQATLHVIRALKPVIAKGQPVTVYAVADQQVDRCAHYRSLLAQYGWDVDVMYGIMRAESRCNPDAINTHNYDGVYDYGLLQLHGQDILDPAQNIAAAYRKWRVQGYRAWTTYNTGAYLSYL